MQCSKILLPLFVLYRNRLHVFLEFLGAGAPLGLDNVTGKVKTPKSFKMNNLFSLASTSILILVTRYLQVHDTWYFHLPFLTVFLLSLIHLILHLLPVACLQWTNNMELVKNSDVPLLLYVLQSFFCCRLKVSMKVFLTGEAC